MSILVFEGQVEGLDEQELYQVARDLEVLVDDLLAVYKARGFTITKVTDLYSWSVGGHNEDE